MSNTVATRPVPRRWILGMTLTAFICYVFAVLGTGFNRVTGEFNIDRLQFNVLDGLFGGIVSTLIVLAILGVVAGLVWGIIKVLRMKNSNVKTILAFITGIAIMVLFPHISFGWLSHIHWADLGTLLIVLLAIFAITWTYSRIMRNK